MASIGWEGKRARILFRDSAGKQQTLRLGECPKSVAESARVAVGHLVIAKRHGSVPHPDAARWLGGIDDALYSRVAALGLCQPREGASVVTLANLLDRFDAAASVKAGTRTTYLQALGMLRKHFGESTPIDSITPAHADEWRKAIADSGLAPATMAKRVKVAKAVFRKAVKWGLIPSSPFADLRAGSQSNPDRAFYVPVESIRAILEACPDDQWRAVVALSRFAGLRCPSEVAALRWGDVNWERGRLMVRSPKTAGHEGHAVRVVPIAPELRPILQDLFDRAEVGVEAVVPRLRDPSMNLRTQFERIIARAGVKPWPRLFHNMRASCATDWVERFPAHVVAGWLGHSPMIAAQHYLQTRDAHFDLAAGVGGIGEAAANPATHTRPRGPTASKPKTQNPQNSSELVGVGVACDPVENRPMTPRGFEPLLPG
ncbi:MAG: site-specific integrase [Phycisphaerae bacterium]|nr:site-specific integrase [Phycisphaerae bacterium]